MQHLIVQRPEGLYCPPGDFFIDPWRRVDRAVITHAHADHARTGHRHYLAAAPGAGLLRARLGDSSAILTTHSMPKIRELCNAVAVLENGKLRWFDDIEQGIAVHNRNMNARVGTGDDDE